jgi:hypothetical protein
MIGNLSVLMSVGRSKGGVYLKVDNYWQPLSTDTGFWGGKKVDNDWQPPGIDTNQMVDEEIKLILGRIA